MFKFVVFASCIVALACAGVAKQKEKRKIREPVPAASHNLGELSVSLGDASGYGGEFGGHQQQIVEYTSGHGGHDSGASSGKKYVSSSELTSLAHTSAQQAKTAVQSQHTAGSQAAFGAKSSLAQAALGAAATAQAALVGKQVIVQGLEHQLHDAEHQLQAEIAQYHQTEQAAQAAQEASQQSQQQVNALTAALATSQGGAAHAAKAASEAANAAAAQHAMIIDAKQRVAHLSEQLHSAVAELQETESSAQKAAAAAHIAQSNAAAAANAVASSAAHSEAQGHDFGGASEGGYHH